MSQAHCDTCGLDQPTDSKQPAALWLGSHKQRVHGIAGSSATTGKRRRRKERGGGLGDRAPRARSGGGGGGSTKATIARDLRATFQVIGGLVRVVDPYCGSVLQTRSDDFCKALAEVAAGNAQIMRWMSAAGKAGPYGALIISAGALAVPIAAHHRLIDPDLAALVGAPIPDGGSTEVDEWAQQVMAGPDMREPETIPRESVPLAAEG